MTTRVPSSSFDSNNTKTATASCGAGKTVLGGGAGIERGTLALSDLVKLFLVYSKPAAGLTGWTGRRWRRARSGRPGR